MVGTPLFADQADNIAGMKAKGKTVRLDFFFFFLLANLSREVLI